MQHSENVKRNNFYGSQYKSSIDFVINDDPSVIKKFKTLGYEGTAGWVAKEIKTDQVTGAETTFKEKENKYFANIVQEAKSLNTLDHKNISSQIAYRQPIMLVPLMMKEYRMVEKIKI